MSVSYALRHVASGVAWFVSGGISRSVACRLAGGCRSPLRSRLLGALVRTRADAVFENGHWEFKIDDSSPSLEDVAPVFETGNTASVEYEDEDAFQEDPSMHITSDLLNALQ